MYYGAVTTGNSGNAITITKAGYVTNTDATATTRGADTAAQVSVSATVKFDLKVTAADELGVAINIPNLSAITFNSVPVTASSGPVAYFAARFQTARLSFKKTAMSIPAQPTRL